VETLDHVGQGYGTTLAPDWDQRIYLASSATLLDVIHDLPAAVDDALLVGHNPGLEELILLLVPEGGALRDDPKARAFREQLERARPTPAVPEWERIATEMQLVAARAVAGELTIDQATAEIDHRVDRILEKRRWVLDHLPPKATRMQ